MHQIHIYSNRWASSIRKHNLNIPSTKRLSEMQLNLIRKYLHFKADLPFVDAIGSSCTWPQVCKTFNGQRVSTIPVTWYLEVQIAIICEKQKTSSKVNNKPFKPFKQILLPSRNIVLSLTSINGHKSVIKIFFLFLCWGLWRTCPVCARAWSIS